MAQRSTVIYGDQIDSSFAGNGLSKDASDDLQLNVDNSSVEISSDILQIKALGVTNAMLAGSITEAKLVDDFIKQSELLDEDNFVSDSATQPVSQQSVKAYIDTNLSGLDFQKDVLDKQVDATLDPGASPTTGDRYIISNSASLHANFGTITGVGDNDIVEYNGSAFVVSYDVSVQGSGALVWNISDTYFERYDGAVWAEFGGLSGVTAGDALSKVGNTLNVNVDDVGVEVVTDALQIKDSGITEAKLNMFNSPAVAKVIGYTVNGMEWIDRISNEMLIEADYVANEIPSGSINSVNTAFTLANALVAGSAQLFYNGQFQAPGGLDYSISGQNITFMKAPRTGSDLYAVYIKD